MTPVAPQPSFPSRYQRPETAPSVARYVTTSDGARIAAYAYGSKDAPCVTMIHGNGEEHGIFGPMIDAAVAAGYRVVAQDSRAQGKSTRGRSHLTYELMAEDVICVLNALGVDRTHVLGFSDGAIECLLLARDWPERVLTACSIGANLTPEGVIEEPGWDLALTARTMRAWADHWSDQAEGAHPDIEVSLLTPTPDEAAITADLFDLMLEEPHIEAASLATITCPVTCVVGEWDCIAESETARIVRSIGGARLVVVNEAWHSLPKHEVEVVTRLMFETIGRHRKDVDSKVPCVYR